MKKIQEELEDANEEMDSAGPVDEGDEGTDSEKGPTEGREEKLVRDEASPSRRRERGSARDSDSSRDSSSRVPMKKKRRVVSVQALRKMRAATNRSST